MKKKKIFEGKTKKIYETENENELVQEFKDDVVSPDGSKKSTLKGKGAWNNQLSVHLFKFLESYYITTHFLKVTSDRDMLVRKLSMIPVVVKVRNVAAGDMVKRFGVAEGKELECPIIEYYLKDKERDDPMINEDHVISFGHATSEEIKEMHRLASKVNAILKAFFRRRHLNLVDLSLEFGRLQHKLVVGDEISLETCHFGKLNEGGAQVFLSMDNPEAYYSELVQLISLT